jgi:AmmeMemoRadiSam system protein B
VTGVRQPAVAGQFYAADPDRLREQIEDAFAHEVGPGSVPEVGSGSGDLVGIVSPHAGYPYSGPVAAHGAAAVAADGAPETVVAVGPNHSGVGAPVAVSGADRWKTPLGELEVDADLTEAILSAEDVGEVDDVAHRDEHSVEVQFPLLQYALGTDFRIVPICMGRQDEGTSQRLGRAIAEAVEDLDRDALLLASTDLTHYEPREVAEREDRTAIDRMTAFDAEGVVEVATVEGVSMCGYGPVAATLVAAQELGASTAEQFEYATSGDTAGPQREVVGYGSVGFYR